MTGKTNTEQKVELFYTGPDGDVNYDVADELGRGARLKTRRHYTVSRPLALSLLATSVWQEKGGPGALTEEARVGTEVRAASGQGTGVDDKASPTGEDPPGETPEDPEADDFKEEKRGVEA